MTVLPVSGHLVSELVATLKPFDQQLRVDAPLTQVESRSASSGTAAANDIVARANRPAPIVRREYIIMERSIGIWNEKNLLKKSQRGDCSSNRRAVRKERNEGLRMEAVLADLWTGRVYIRSDADHKFGTGDPSLIATALRDNRLSGPLVQDLYLL